MVYLTNTRKMKKQLYILYLILYMLPLGILSQTSVMSFNIRYDNPNDKENWWQYRKADLSKMIQFYTPDILGVQEALHTQVKYLDSTLVGYNYIGVGRDDGKRKGEYAAIYYNKKKFKLLNTKTYWLSETPNSISVGWDAAMERIVTVGEFQDKRNGDRLYVFNAHFDHLGKLARNKSAELLLKLIKKMSIQNNKIILMGDLNCNPNDAPIKTLQTKVTDTYKVSTSKPYGPIGTFNGFDLKSKLTKRIDYIFVKNLEVMQYITIDDRRSNNLYLSDHFPVFVRIK